MALRAYSCLSCPEHHPFFPSRSPKVSCRATPPNPSIHATAARRVIFGVGRHISEDRGPRLIHKRLKPRLRLVSLPVLARVFAVRLLPVCLPELPCLSQCLAHHVGPVFERGSKLSKLLGGEQFTVGVLALQFAGQRCKVLVHLLVVFGLSGPAYAWVRFRHLGNQRVNPRRVAWQFCAVAVKQFVPHSHFILLRPTGASTRTAATRRPVMLVVRRQILAPCNRLKFIRPQAQRLTVAGSHAHGTPFVAPAIVFSGSHASA